jgi:hypothetical protein
LKNLKIGYVPISMNLSHPADRRRVVFWAKNRGHEIVTDLTLPHDVVVISERADIGSWSRKDFGAPRIFDLIDGYLEPMSIGNDLLRGYAKFATGQTTGSIRRFSKQVEKLCTSVQGVICSTPEQRNSILRFNLNVHPILDSHDEFPLLVPRIVPVKNKEIRLFWEGLPFTLPNLSIFESVLKDIDSGISVTLSVVTDSRYPKYLGKYLTRDTSRYIQKTFPILSSKMNLVPWSPSRVKESAVTSDLGILPISINEPMNNYKAENRLLIMWRLGLPVLASPTKAYARVFNSIGSDGICTDAQNWVRQLENFTRDEESFMDQIRRGQEYLSEHHSREKLLQSWDTAIGSVL